MDRLACVDLPAFRLQILLRRHPDWRGWPSAVVSRDSPQGEILATCTQGRQRGIQPGQSYATGLALVPELRAGSLSPADIEEEKTLVCKQLGHFSPYVEPAEEEPGVFWVDAGGLDLLHGSPQNWATALEADLQKSGYVSSVVVGHSRFGTFALARNLSNQQAIRNPTVTDGGALARSQRGIAVLASPEEEVAATARVPLSRLGLTPSALAGLLQLGQRTVGDLLRLPKAGLLERFGPQVHRLRCLAGGDLFAPLQPVFTEEPPGEKLYLDDPEANTLRLTFLVKRLLRTILRTAAGRHEHVTGLELSLVLDRQQGRQTERLRTAQPTLDEKQLVDLVRLRLESLQLPVGATEIWLQAETVPASPRQLHLFPAHPLRDMEQADRALARLRAEFGTAAVVRAKMRDGHLPEARFSLEPLDHVRLPKPILSPTDTPCPLRLVRRILKKPVPLQTRPVVGPRGCHLLGMGEAPAWRITEPYVISGGWWIREVHREYHFAETDTGKILWVYFDKKRRSWFYQGEVE